MTSSDKNFKPDVNFLFEIGNLRFMPRMGNRFFKGMGQNLAEHHFRVFWIAMVIAAHEGNVDTGKIAKMTLLHDIPESRTGDVDYLTRQYTERNEDMSLDDMLGNTPLKEEFLALWKEYEARETLEARIAKDADNLDVDFDLAEQAALGRTLNDKWKEARQFIAKKYLYTETARAIFEQLEKSDPHDWHLEGRNRLNNGDWK
jgi:5'-deoxynucleotidase YfbR-like HD superfamily hydrolase